MPSKKSRTRAKIALDCEGGECKNNMRFDGCIFRDWMPVRVETWRKPDFEPTETVFPFINGDLFPPLLSGLEKIMPLEPPGSLFVPRPGILRETAVPTT